LCRLSYLLLYNKPYFPLKIREGNVEKGYFALFWK